MEKTKRILIVLAVLPVLVAGCGYGPRHLPALYRQRDHIQRVIDGIVTRMVTDQRWWDSLGADQQRHWKEYLEKVRLEERERALTAIDALAEGVHMADTTTTR